MIKIGNNEKLRLSSFRTFVSLKREGSHWKQTQLSPVVDENLLLIGICSEREKVVDFIPPELFLHVAVHFLSQKCFCRVVVFRNTFPNPAASVYRKLLNIRYLCMPGLQKSSWGGSKALQAAEIQSRNWSTIVHISQVTWTHHQSESKV